MLSIATAPLHAHAVPTAVESFIILRDKRSYSMLIQVFDLCYQPSCHICFRLAIIFKFVTAKVLLQHWKMMTAAQRKISLDMFIICVDSSVYTVITLCKLIS